MYIPKDIRRVGKLSDGVKFLHERIKRGGGIYNVISKSIARCNQKDASPTHSDL